MTQANLGIVWRQFTRQLIQLNPIGIELVENIFPFMKVLEFNYHIIELKKRNWRDYIESNNPVAAALLSKMGYNEKDRVEIKTEVLRVITRMRIDMAKKTLI